MAPFERNKSVLSYPKRKLEAKSNVTELGESSRRCIATPTSSQEGTLIGYYDDRKQKINNSETKMRNYRSENGSEKRKMVVKESPLKSEICGICMGKKTKAEMLSTHPQPFCLSCIQNLDTKMRNYRSANGTEKRKMVVEEFSLKSEFCGICVDKKTKVEILSTCPQSFCIYCVQKHVDTKMRDNRSESESVKRKRVIEEYPLKSAFCGICMDMKTKEEMLKSTCRHSFCLACVGQMVATKIRDKVVKVKCPDPGCNVLLEPRNCKSFVPSQVIDQWEAALCESSLGSEKIYCPFRDCSALLIRDGQKIITSAECQHCHRLFCARCLVPWHSGLLCKSVEGNRMDNKFIELAKKEKWQKCPSCKFYVQKNHGCECISCRCGHKFCYICGYGWQYGHVCPARKRC